MTFTSPHVMNSVMQQGQPELKTYPPKVIGTITTLEDWLMLEYNDISDQCDWIELRLDTFPQHVTTDELMKNKPNMPILATARREAEGGKRPMADSERFELLQRFIPYAHAIDIEIATMNEASNLIRDAKNINTLIVASSHDFQHTPNLNTLLELNQKAIDQGADIVKFAFNLESPADLSTGIQFLEQVNNPAAIMGMGPLGPVSRILFSQLGSCLIYGYLGNHEAAPGQWPVLKFKESLALLSSFYNK